MTRIGPLKKKFRAAKQKNIFAQVPYCSDHSPGWPETHFLSFFSLEGSGLSIVKGHSSQLREEKMCTLSIPNPDFHNLALLDVQAAM